MTLKQYKENSKTSAFSVEKGYFTMFFIPVENSQLLRGGSLGKVKASISQFKHKMLKMAKG